MLNSQFNFGLAQLGLCRGQFDRLCLLHRLHFKLQPLLLALQFQHRLLQLSLLILLLGLHVSLRPGVLSFDLLLFDLHLLLSRLRCRVRLLRHLRHLIRKRINRGLHLAPNAELPRHVFQRLAHQRRAGRNHLDRPDSLLQEPANSRYELGGALLCGILVRLNGAVALDVQDKRAQPLIPQQRHYLINRHGFRKLCGLSLKPLHLLLNLLLHLLQHLLGLLWVRLCLRHQLRILLGRHHGLLCLLLDLRGLHLQ